MRARSSGSARLLLDVGGLRAAQAERLGGRAARHRLQLRVAQREAQERDGEPVDEQDRRDVRAWHSASARW